MVVFFAVEQSLLSALILPVAVSVKKQRMKELHTLRLLLWNCMRRGKTKGEKVFSDISNTVMTLSNTIK
jgi:hypothetical protein